VSGYKNVTEELFEIVKKNINIILKQNGFGNSSHSQIEYYAATTLGFNNHEQLKDILNIKKIDFIDFSHTTDEDIIKMITKNQFIKDEINEINCDNWNIEDIINNINGFIEIPKERFNEKLKDFVFDFYNNVS
jgi:excinuclease UvrABC nuclease subunit